MSVPHRLRFSLEQRQTESARIMQRFPGRIPIIIEKSNRATDIPDLPRNRYLAPADMTVGQFIYVIRKSISLPPEKALFVFVGTSLPTTGMIIRELYRDYHHEDGFLYATYSGESTFGGGEGQ
jgi:GABA(A) receptor-associated protein